MATKKKPVAPAKKTTPAKSKTVPVIFKKNGAPYGYGYVYGDKGQISGADLKRLAAAGVVIPATTKNAAIEKRG